MPRIARKNYESSYFHVIVQGYEKEYIFETDFFKTMYLKYVLEERKKYEVELLEYCIMGNHAHLLLYCDKIEQMSLYMKNVNTQYAILYNKVKNRVGYVFRDRFLSEPIMNEKHLYSCIPYIHLNPVVAKIVSMPREYKYSSYNDFINKRGIVTDSVLLKLFGSKDDYLSLFNFLHLGSGEGIEYKNDERKVSMFQAKEIIEKILKENNITNLKVESEEVQKIICKLLIKERIAIYHIEKVLNIDHRRIRRILNL